MKNWKKILAAAVLSLGIMGTVFAAGERVNPAEITASLTGRSVESVVDEHYQTGKSFCVIADEAGKLSEFKQEILKAKKEELDQRVADGTMSRERADRILKNIESRQEYCGYSHRYGGHGCDYDYDYGCGRHDRCCGYRQ